MDLGVRSHRTVSYNKGFIISMGTTDLARSISMDKYEDMVINYRANPVKTAPESPVLS